MGLGLRVEGYTESLNNQSHDSKAWRRGLKKQQLVPLQFSFHPGIVASSYSNHFGLALDACGLPKPPPTSHLLSYP